MPVRSLPHFAHKPIGKTTHKKGMSYQHVNYITREDACSKTQAQNMPADRDGARPYFEHEAAKDGVAANARIADTLIIALPLELTREQRHAAIAGFMDKIGHGRIAWLAAFHDLGKDEHNPHCHLIFRDADIDTGRKVVGTTTSAKDVREALEHGWRVPPRMTTKDLRMAWCDHLNAEMERHGLDVRFDQRRLKEQGIDREPGIHVGPKAMSMAEKDRAFFSQDRKRGDHANIYTLLDAGSRAEHNQRIIDANRQREAEKRNGRTREAARPLGREGQDKRALREAQAAARRAMWADQKRDRQALRAAHDTQKLHHQRWGRALYAEARETAFQEVKAQNADKWNTVHKIAEIKAREDAALALKAQQKTAYDAAATKQIEQARPVKNEAWENLKLAQDTERQQLQRRHGEETAALARQHIAERHALHETWRGRHLDTEAQRINARLEAHQGMASVQTTAIAMIKHHAQDQQRHSKAGEAQPAAHPLEAAKLFSERARAESANQAAIRYELNAGRQLNQTRAAAPAEQRRVPVRTADRQPTTTTAQKNTRRVVRQQSDAQNGVRQAIASGRSLSSTERANASPEIKAALSSKEKTDKSRREDAFLRFISQRSDKGRSGGRSGR